MPLPHSLPHYYCTHLHPVLPLPRYDRICRLEHAPANSAKHVFRCRARIILLRHDIEMSHVGSSDAAWWGCGPTPLKLRDCTPTPTSNDDLRPRVPPSNVRLRLRVRLEHCPFPTKQLFDFGAKWPQSQGRRVHGTLTSYTLLLVGMGDGDPQHDDGILREQGTCSLCLVPERPDTEGDQYQHQHGARYPSLPALPCPSLPFPPSPFPGPATVAQGGRSCWEGVCVCVCVCL